MAPDFLAVVRQHAEDCARAGLPDREPTVSIICSSVGFPDAEVASATMERLSGRSWLCAARLPHDLR
jgi:hypothetical protein